MSEKYPLLAAEEKCFYLTSPFIEPDGLDSIGLREFFEAGVGNPRLAYRNTPLAYRNT
jgi:hypothetical protein